MRVRIEPTFEGWRNAARTLLAAGIAPSRLLWDDGSEAFLAIDDEEMPSADAEARVALSKRFVHLAQNVSAHREPARWDLLYRIAFRLLNENRELLADEVDDDVSRLMTMAKQIERDIHKMHAFVRFRQVSDESGERFVAWHRPDHAIVRLAAPFFVDRFRTMRWSILTPEESAHFENGALEFKAGVSLLEAPAEDDYEAMWRSYYASTFNPARLNLPAMRSEMPARFWRNLPELKDLARLIDEAPGRVQTMVELQRGARNATPWIPAERDHDSLAAAAQKCEGCELFGGATQAVFGEGPVTARVMMVGEQPGDEEDRQGHPFLGSAGRMLDRALADAGLERAQFYVTNAVKHFAYIERGTKRIHRSPKLIEVTACKPWLAAEIELVKPELIVCLGATAARSVGGPTFRLMEERGEFLQTRSGRTMIATIHPAAVLRAEEELAAQYYAWLVADLVRVRERLALPSLG